MHDRSLPSSDRIDPAATIDRVEKRSAFVIQLADGSYFRDFRPKGRRVVSVRLMKLAKIYPRKATDTIDRTLAKLRRHGVKAKAVPIEVLIG